MSFLRSALKVLGYTVLFIIGSIAVYLSSAFLLSRIGTEKESAAEDVAIYILSNGVHVDLVLPIKNEQIDWSTKIPFTNTKGKDSLMRYLALGWGDKGFYLETPTWADLKFSTAFKAMFFLSSSAIHATYYKSMNEGEDCKKIYLSKEQYSQLINYILESFDQDSEGKFSNIRTNATYGNTDAFYEATGTYSFLHTCNTWTNNGLKSCGQKASWWTPFSKGIFYQYRAK